MKKKSVTIGCIIMLLSVFLSETVFAYDYTILEKSTYHETDFENSPYVTIKTEHEVYSPDIDTITLYIQNNSKENLNFDSVYDLEVLHDNQWLNVSPRDFNAIGYMLFPNSTAHDLIGIAHEHFDKGNYRIIKKINGKLYAAYFSLGESKYTKDTPFGYTSIEKLPQNYTVKTAEKNGDVVFTSSQIKNETYINDFLDKVMKCIPAMLRTVHKNKNGIVINDIIYNGDYFLVKQDDSRMNHTKKEGITSELFSYILSDGNYLYLSNFVSFDEAKQYSRESEKHLILSDMNKNKLKTYAKQILDISNKRHLGNATSYRIISPEGNRDAILSQEEPLQYGYGGNFSDGGSFGTMETISDAKGIAIKAIDITWLDNEVFYVTCTTREKENLYLTVRCMEKKILSEKYGLTYDSAL